MIFTVIPMSALTADASAWDSAGYDCVAYAKARFREMWGFELHATGMTNGYYGAHGYYYNAANYGDIVSGTPKAGALAVWTSNYNVYGHVAVVESVSGGNVTYTEGGFYDENKGGNRANRATRSASAMSYSWNDSKYGHCKQTFLGYVYVKGTSLTNPKPGKSNLSVSKTSVGKGENFTVSWTASSNTSSYNLKYIYNGTYYNYSSGLTATSKSVSFSKEGTYEIYVDSCNSNGYTQSNVVKVTVKTVPSKSTLTVKRGTSKANTAFNWTKTSNTSYYILNIKTKAGKTVVSLKTKYLKCTRLLSAGSYYATVTSVCSNGRTAVSSKKEFTISKAPAKSSDGWYYLSYLPNNITSDKYTIQYKNTTTKIATKSPGSSYKNKGLSKSVYENSGDAYNSNVPLSTSNTRVLISTSYYHYCGPTVGNNANYFADSKYVHYDGISSKGLTEASSKNDYDNPSIKFYTLKNSSGKTVYCSSGYSCDGSWGSHGARSPYWYKTYRYQNKVLVKYYKYTKVSSWTSSKDSSATSVQVRYKLKTSATPAVVKNVKVANTASGAKLTWSKSTKAKTYKVYRSSYSGGKWSSYKLCLTTSKTYFTDKSVKSGSKVKYKVYALNGSYKSKESAAVTTVYLSNCTPKVTKTTKNIKVKWSKVKGAKGYIVYRRTYSKGKWTSLKAFCRTSSLAYTDKTAKKGVKYQYVIIAYNGSYKSAVKYSSTVKR